MAKRDQDVHFLASKEEVERIHEKMDELGIRSMGAYLRKMALDGYCIRLDLQDVKALVSLLRICSNNLNQYAKRANETGSIYRADILAVSKNVCSERHSRTFPSSNRSSAAKKFASFSSIDLSSKTSIS